MQDMLSHVCGHMTEYVKGHKEKSSSFSSI